ncbi:uncharacterized protein [Apostichopus japonicus]|uniref:uncharacterized protein n=1 Tax=Stichopus japonicus TaxID=307972 RepID=UPI003AB641D8
MQGLSRSAQSTDALQIGSFLLEPLKALFFLESIDCDHPAICSRKVLLTPSMVCKLYDFNLRSATKKMLSNTKFEKIFAFHGLPRRPFSRNIMTEKVMFGPLLFSSGRYFFKVLLRLMD